MIGLQSSALVYLLIRKLPSAPSTILLTFLQFYLEKVVKSFEFSKKLQQKTGLKLCFLEFSKCWRCDVNSTIVTNCASVRQKAVCHSKNWTVTCLSLILMWSIVLAFHWNRNFNTEDIFYCREISSALVDSAKTCVRLWVGDSY